MERISETHLDYEECAKESKYSFDSIRVCPTDICIWYNTPIEPWGAHGWDGWCEVFITYNDL